MSHFKDQLLPSLFDRLTDDEPRKNKEATRDRIMNLEHYRQAVLRDILFLLNTGNLQSHGLVDRLPENVESSVLNYGVIPFSGVNFSDIEWVQVEQNIKNAIMHFEPRLDKETLQVEAKINEMNDMAHNKLVIEIKGYLKLNPYSQAFLLRTQMDIETGMFDLAGHS
ncbi:MAG: type VI secretion system baseplate subunit TssE [Alysiella sp.]|uniref:type VI secretion system baseplate subunit TssE n=1 Tax=Alysiella sp. TaxID=1872483 RepID=UPI0026DB17E7|nr:type VI secretion system baseplate subunit TssE [Alysiella sp.]MDO4433989.1 type VI secretion system baseplate subunit TssE [Alysiella sp.]